MGDGIRQALEDIHRRTVGRSRPIDNLYQPVVFVKKPDEVVKFGPFKKRVESTPFQFYCKNVFVSSDEAKSYFPTYVKSLVASGDLPSEAIDADGELDQDVVACAVYECVLSQVETIEREIEMELFRK